MTNFWSVGLLMLLLCGESIVCERGSIIIQNNGYRHILVAVAENVPENNELVHQIKDMITSASEFLYNATRRRAFFEEVTILLPNTWPDKAEYERAGRAAIEKSDILIDEPQDEWPLENTPIVINPNPCGQTGHFMRLTSAFVLNDDVSRSFGPRAKALVHSWAHLRYGVFDEFPGECDDHFYAVRGGEFEPTKCTSAIQGSWYNKKTGENWCEVVENMPEKDCRFQDQNIGHGKYGSLMYKQHLDNVVEFCDNDISSIETLHNRAAPTRQNILCESKSVWEVMGSHQDFASANFEREVHSTTPKFRIVHEKTSFERVVLVLDVSGSMGGKKIHRLGQACSNYINYIMRDNDKLGIVTFSTVAHIDKYLTTINSANRQVLVNYIPQETKYTTSIGAGIVAALNVLNADSEGTSDATIIVVSDGEENSRPYIQSVSQRVIDANVTLHSIAITNAADSKVDRLAEATGGLSFLYTAEDNSNALNEALMTIGQLHISRADRRHTVQSRVAMVEGNGGSFERRVTIDVELGRETEFTFDGHWNDTRITLMDAENDLNIESMDRDTRFGIYHFKVPQNSQSSSWWYRIENTGQSDRRVAVSVTSKPVYPELLPITAKAYWGIKEMTGVVPEPERSIQRIHVSVSKGFMAVLNAQVYAVIELPDHYSQIVKQLMDNGVGADLTRNDGIYSAYFWEYTESGRYNIKAIVNGVNTTIIRPSRIIGHTAASCDTDNMLQPSDFPTGIFQRTVSGGSFQLANFSTEDPPPKIFYPARVKDLRVSSVDYDSQTVTLQWSAVGAELDRGRASSYELRMGMASEDILSNFSSQTLVTEEMVLRGCNLSSPRSPHEREELVISVPAKGNITYAFGLVARDTAGRDVTGPLSNVVSASLKCFPPRKHKPTQQATQSPGSEESDDEESDSEESNCKGQASPGGLAKASPRACCVNVALIVGIVILCIVIIAGAIFIARKCQMQAR